MAHAKIRRLAFGGLLTAVIAALTAYVRISIPGGYLNPGDAAIALAGVLMGPFAAIPAALGSMLADLMGFPQYALFTLVIKGIMGLVVGFGCREGRLGVKSVLSMLLAGVVLVGGYFIADIILADIGLAIADLPWNALQFLMLLAGGIACLVLGVGKFARRL